MAFTLDTVVRSFMTGRLGLDAIDRRYACFLACAIDGLNDLYNANIGDTEKEVQLEVQDNGTVNLPSDYIDYYAIGFSNGVEFIGLGLNTNLTDVTRDDCGDRVVSENIFDENYYGGYVTYPYNDRGEYLGGNFGVGGGRSSVGEYKIYRDKGYIALSGFDGTHITLRYKADINFNNGDTVVHPYNVEAVKSWLWLEYVMKNHSLGEKQFAKEDYKKKKNQALMQHSRFSVREFLSAYKSGYRSSPNI